mgnify:CR=1 FL=1
MRHNYNYTRRKLYLPEYGRHIHEMVDSLLLIEDRVERTRQAKAVIAVMGNLNPLLRDTDDFKHKLWDHLHIISGFDLDIDAPYPMPAPESLNQKPEPVPLNTKPIKATHYGRNIESIIDLIAEKEDGEVKTAMIRQLAVYMRQQYLIWNKDTVADETIFQDIEKLSDGRIKVPEGIQLSRIDSGATFARPGMNQGKGKMQNQRHKNNNMKMRNKQHK